MRKHVHTDKDDSYRATLTVESASVHLHIIDMAEAPSETHLYIDGAIAVFNTTSRKSFEELVAFSSWFHEFNRKGGFVSLVGTMRTSIGQRYIQTRFRASGLQHTSSGLRSLYEGIRPGQGSSNHLVCKPSSCRKGPGHVQHIQWGDMAPSAEPDLDPALV